MMALWREAPLEEVLRVVCGACSGWVAARRVRCRPAKSAISQARTRLGPGRQAAWTWLTSLPTAAFFGYPGAWRGQSAFPQARVLGLVGCGTHAVVAAGIAPYS